MQINCLSNTEMSSFADSSVLSSSSTQESLNIESKKNKKYIILKTWDHTCLSHDLKSEYKKKDWIFYYKYYKNLLYEYQNSLLFWNHFFKKHDINIQLESYKIKIFNLLKL